MAKVIGYTRVSTEIQTNENQKLAIYDYANRNKIVIDEIIEIKISSRKSNEDRKINILIDKLEAGDTLIVYAIDRLGRKFRESINIIGDIMDKKIRLVIVKDNMTIDPNNNNPFDEAFIMLMALFANWERDFNRQRVNAGLARARAEGRVGGRKKGQKVKSIYDEHIEKIKELLELGVTQKKISQKLGIGTVQSLGQYIKKHKLNIENK